MASRPVLFINSFINLRGPEGAGNADGLESYKSLMHPNAGRNFRKYARAL